MDQSLPFTYRFPSVIRAFKAERELEERLLMVSLSEFRVEGMSFLPRKVKIEGAVRGGRRRRNEVVLVVNRKEGFLCTQCSSCLS
jgi:hypothetical protein